MRRTRVALSVVVGALAAGSVAIGTPAAAAPGDVDLQLLALSDFHGRIAPQSGGDGTLSAPDGPDDGTDPDSLTVGGAAYMATLLDQLAADFASTSDNGDGSYFVGAGDLISASPFESSVYKDEPTIEVLNALGLDYSSVGNHEFDRGFEELLRIIDGGCTGTPNVDSCFTDSTGDTTFDGADFPYLGANVLDGNGDPVLPEYEIIESGGVRLGLIGIVTSDTPNLVTPTGIAGLTFEDEATAINRVAGELQAQGIEAIGVLIHEGGTQTGLFNDCADLVGPIADINGATTAAVDLIISAHTHLPYDCSLPDPDGDLRPVTQAGFYGKAVTDIRMEINAGTGEVDRATITADNVPVDRAVLTPDPEVQGIVDYWLAQSAGPRAEVLGTQTADLDRAYLAGAPVRNAESGFGNLIADAQLDAMDDDPGTFGDPVAAFMNPGGIRSDINCADVPSGEPVGTITFGEAFTAQPFSNTVNVVTITGADIDLVLEQQWRLSGTVESLLLLSTSDSLHYEYDPRLPIGERVDIASITIDGAPINAGTDYTIVANSFLTAGGDGFSAFTNGSTPVTGPNDVDALADYVGENSPVTPPALDRAVSLDPAQPQDDDGSGTGPCDLPIPPGPVVTVSPTTVAVGETLTVTGSGFDPGETVAASLDSQPAFGSRNADAVGTVTFSVQIRASIGLGSHTAVLTGASSGTGSASFTVVTAGSTLPQTGSNTSDLAALGGLLLLSGAGACAVGRRRRSVVLAD